MTEAEARWRAKRTQQLLESGLERFDALAELKKCEREKPGMGSFYIVRTPNDDPPKKGQR